MSGPRCSVAGGCCGHIHGRKLTEDAFQYLVFGLRRFMCFYCLFVRHIGRLNCLCGKWWLYVGARNWALRSVRRCYSGRPTSASSAPESIVTRSGGAGYRSRSIQPSKQCLWIKLCDGHALQTSAGSERGATPQFVYVYARADGGPPGLQPCYTYRHLHGFPAVSLRHMDKRSVDERSPVTSPQSVRHTHT